MMMYRMMGGNWGNWDSMPDYMKDMMQGYWGGARPFWAVAGIFELVMSLLVIAVLIALVRYLWKLGDRK